MTLDFAILRIQWSDNPPTDDPVLKQSVKGRASRADLLCAEAEFDYRRAAERVRSEVTEETDAACWNSIIEQMDPPTRKSTGTVLDQLGMIETSPEETVQAPSHGGFALALRNLFDINVKEKEVKAVWYGQRSDVRHRLHDLGIRRHIKLYWWDVNAAYSIVLDDHGQSWQFPYSDLTFVKPPLITSHSDGCFAYLEDEHNTQNGIALPLAPGPTNMLQLWAEPGIFEPSDQTGSHPSECLTLVAVVGSWRYSMALWRDRATKELVGWSAAYSIAGVYRQIENQEPVTIHNNNVDMGEVEHHIRHHIRNQLAL
jgi:hypothetical protein